MHFDIGITGICRTVFNPNKTPYLENYTRWFPSDKWNDMMAALCFLTKVTFSLLCICLFSGTPPLHPQNTQPLPAFSSGLSHSGAFMEAGEGQRYTEQLYLIAIF